MSYVGPKEQSLVDQSETRLVDVLSRFTEEELDILREEILKRGARAQKHKQHAAELMMALTACGFYRVMELLEARKERAS